MIYAIVKISQIQGQGYFVGENPISLFFGKGGEGTAFNVIYRN